MVIFGKNRFTAPVQRICNCDDIQNDNPAKVLNVLIEGTLRFSMISDRLKNTCSRDTVIHREWQNRYFWCCMVWTSAKNS